MNIFNFTIKYDKHNYYILKDVNHMTWEYKVSTGILSHNGKLIATVVLVNQRINRTVNTYVTRAPFHEAFILLLDGIIIKVPPLLSSNLLQGQILLAEIISKFMVIKKGSHRERHLQDV